MHEVHQHASTNQRASKINNMHPQKRMYTTTSCWTRLSSGQGTACTWRRGLLWQRALRTAVQTTEAKDSHKLTNPTRQDAQKT
jgi:hypothetical protein